MAVALTAFEGTGSFQEADSEDDDPLDGSDR